MGATPYSWIAQGSRIDAEGPQVTNKLLLPSQKHLAFSKHAPERGPPSFPPACSSGAGRSPWCGTRCLGPFPARFCRAMQCWPLGPPAGPGARRRARAPSPTPPAEGWTWRGSGVRSAGLEDRCRGCPPTLIDLRPRRKQELVRLERSDFKTAAATSATVTWSAVRRHRTRPLGWSLGTCGSRTAGIGLDARGVGSDMLSSQSPGELQTEGAVRGVEDRWAFPQFVSQSQPVVKILNRTLNSC